MGRSAKGSELEEMKDSEGKIVTGDEMVECIEKTWGQLLNTEGDAVLGVEKERRLMNEGGDIKLSELEKALKKLNTGRAWDEEGVSGEHLKALKEVGKEALRRVLNDVLNGGEIPPSWRRSRVMLLHKGGERKCISNYRPVAITSVVYKVFMMILRSRLEKWVEEKGLLNDLQGGFRRKRRTDDNLFILNQ
jgi:hypothetical protein